MFNDVCCRKMKESRTFSSSDEESYEVQKVLGRRIHNEKAQFLVRWKGCGPEEDSWEPESNLIGCKELVHDFLLLLKTSEFSPRKTRRRSAIIKQHPEKGSYTKLRTPRKQKVAIPENKVIHLKTPPPLSPKKEKGKVFEEKLPSSCIKEEKGDVSPTQVRSKFGPRRVLITAAVIGLLVIVFTSLFPLVNQKWSLPTR